jgi:hypothetical protein
MKSSNDGTGAKTVEAAIVESSNDGAGATVKSSSEGATMKAAAKAAHAASVSTATAATAAAAATTAASLCTRRKQRPSKQGGCQYHHHSSSSHELFLSTGRAISDHRTSRPGLIWSPGSEWLTGNFEGSNRTSRWHWHQNRKGRCRSAAQDR